MSAIDDRYLLKLKALHYHYEKKITQTETAKLLGISRVTLSKLIKEAWDEGMINIEIVDYRHMGTMIRLEDQLQSKYGLDMVKVVDCQNDDRGLITHSIGKAAAKYLDGLMKSNIKISVSWGSTLEATVNHITANPSLRDIELYTLVGTAGVSTPQTQPNLIVQNLLQKIKGSGYIINAPFICQSKELCDAIKREPHIEKVLSESKAADIVLLGIGDSPDVAAKRQDTFHYSEEIMSEMQDLGAVGDICGNFYDIKGELLNTSFSDRMVAIDIRELRGRRGVICMGGGRHKVRSIIGALNGKYFSELVTDKFTAERLVAFKE